MGSNSREVQLAQKEQVEQELTARLATLTERGMSDKQKSTDTIVRKLRADIRSLNHRLEAIDSVEARVKKQAEHKAAQAAAPRLQGKKKKGKKKLEAEKAAEQAKGKGKKKKKK